MKKTMILGLFLIVVVVVVFLWICMDNSGKDNMARAQQCYAVGEAFFAHHEYKQAMWNYELVCESYGRPHTKWQDLAQEKEWICRGYLNDWTPDQGSLLADIRRIRADLYEKYKPELMQITPVAQRKNKP